MILNILSDLGQAERQAVNTTIQGSAADIAKVGMLKVEGVLKKHCPGVHLVLQLHDELIYEVKLLCTSYSTSFDLFH